jgi:UDP-2,4-diacetamido-2,4,6-trideoxy-beta-L-altropyranose hydrolase
MNITFRADASLDIGTGHVMRCLTLADALSAQSANCQFICRQHEGHLIELIRSKGYVVHVLTAQNTDVEAKTKALPSADKLAHSRWLGTSQAQDAAACAPILAAQPPDWLVVDHYALDSHWESALMPHYRKLMVIDDLADRHHVCDLLLDQTFDRSANDYHPLVPEHCQLLCGAAYALLRPEFAALRPYSLQRRAQPALHQLLINMGGVDKDNVTGQVLQALHDCSLPADCHIIVVMGANAPWLDSVRAQVQNMPWPTKVLVGINNMAQIMADSDLAIGAAGSTSWERCCLGLPTILLVLAENQKYAAQLLEKSKVTHNIQASANLKKSLIEGIQEFLSTEEILTKLCKVASTVTDGQGCKHLIRKLI